MTDLTDWTDNPTGPTMRQTDARILVTGSRSWTDETRLRDALDACWVHCGAWMIVIHGACPQGADAMAATWCRDRDVRQEPHPADWQRGGRAAGFRRNIEMVDAGADTVLAFICDRSAGATHCAAYAQTQGIEVAFYREPLPSFDRRGINEARS